MFAVALSPAFRAVFMTASGVAPVVASKPRGFELKLFMNFAQEMMRKQRPASAGFIQFWPRPPNICFAMMIAKTAPSAGIQSGISGGMFSARIIPVTTAEKSEMVTVFFMPFCQRNSEITAAATVTTITSSALMPNCTTP